MIAVVLQIPQLILLVTTAKAIQELLDVRDKIKEMPELSYNDVDDMIDNLCSM